MSVPYVTRGEIITVPAEKGDARVITIRFFNDWTIRNSYFAVFLHACGCVRRRYYWLLIVRCLRSG